MITILEDCSPYYIRLTHDGIDDIINNSLSYLEGVTFTNKFTHYRYPLKQAVKLLSSTPMHRLFNINMNRVSMFVSQPGYCHPIHLDGPSESPNRISINYTVKVLDDKCSTSWYNNKELNDYPITDDPGYSRDLIGFDHTTITPLKTMVANRGECILLNTDIFHNFDNSLSTNERMILTFRLDNKTNFINFDDARRILFGGLAQLGER